jgi:hypothetical protein
MVLMVAALLFFFLLDKILERALDEGKGAAPKAGEASGGTSSDVVDKSA